MWMKAADAKRKYVDAEEVFILNKDHDDNDDDDEEVDEVEDEVVMHVESLEVEKSSRKKRC